MISPDIKFGRGDLSPPSRARRLFSRENTTTTRTFIFVVILMTRVRCVNQPSAHRARRVSNEWRLVAMMIEFSERSGKLLCSFYKFSYAEYSLIGVKIIE